jgi:hypothetical protein
LTLGGGFFLNGELAFFVDLVVFLELILLVVFVFVLEVDFLA